MEFKLTKSFLRPWRQDDAESLALHANNKEIAKNLRDIFPFPYTLSDANFFINQVIVNSDIDINLAIEVDNSAVGAIGVHFMTDVYRKNAEFGYWISEKFQRRGIVTEALLVLVEFVFKNFDIKRAYACVFETNIASMKVLEKCGFTREAVHHNAIIKNNVQMDEYIYSLINYS